MKKKCLLTVLFVGCAMTASFAQMTLQGKVVDEKGNPIPGANVRLEQTTIGCATDKDGLFSLRDVADGNYVLRASCLDYDAETQKINKSSNNLVFQLKDSYINLNQVVVTGTGTHHKLKDSPVPIEVINSNDLKKAGVVNFDQAMNMLNPSFSFSTNAMGSFMTLNGLGNKYILVLIDGKKLAGDISGNTDLSRIDMSNVKRIEVLKGAASSLYGSEAIAGVINIITDQPKNFLNVTSNTRYEGHNQFTQSANIDITTQKFGSYTSYKRDQADGWQLSDVEESEDKEGNVIYEPTDKEASNKYFANVASQKFTFAPTEQLSGYVEGSFYNKENDRPVSEYSYNMAYQDYALGLGAKYLLGNAAYISLDLMNDNFESTKEYIQEDKKNKIAIGESVLSKRQHYYNANLKGVFRAGKYNKLTVGTEYINDQLKNPESLPEDKSVYTLALYAQDEIKFLDHWQVIAGLRYNYHETFKNRFTPKASVMYSLGNVNLRASYAAGFRAPSLEQLYYNKPKGTTISIGNVNLKPEKSNYYSVNAEYVGSRITASVTAYLNNISDMINSVTEKPTAEEVEQGYKKRNVYVNIDEARIKGIDFNMNSYLGAGFAFSAGYSFADAKDTKTDTRLVRSIRHTGSLSGNWTKQWNQYRLNVNLTGRVQGDRYHDDGNAPKYSLWNLTTRHTFTQVGDFILEPGLGIDNLFNYQDNRPFGSNYSTLSPGRTVFASLLIRFKQ